MRRRRREDEEEEVAGRLGGDTQKRGALRSVVGACCSTGKRKLRCCVAFVICILALYHAVCSIVRMYHKMERSIKDPFREAQLFMPFRYFSIRYIQARPVGERAFYMTNQNSFVINLEEDVNRWQQFQKLNSNLTNIIQRFPATRIIFPKSQQHTHKTAPHKTNKNDTLANNHTIARQEEEAYRVQQWWLKEYPSLAAYADGSREEIQWGDIACSLSHLKLMQHKLVDTAAKNNHELPDYIFAFEDDVKILAPLDGDRFVTAPADADVVFLMPTSTKTVLVPYDRPANTKGGLSHGSRNNTTISLVDRGAVRVIQGYGAQGYVITRQGAMKLLQDMKREGGWRGNDRVPFDVFLARAKNLRVYHPTNGWPQVEHVRNRFMGHSTRRTHNKRWEHEKT